MTSQSTRDLMKRARGGDSAAETHLFEAVAERVHLYIRLRLGAALRQEVDSFDVLQETFLTAHEKASDFEAEAPGAYLAWLCRIAEHRIKKLAEYRGAAKRKPRGEREDYSDIIEGLRHSDTGPLSAVLHSERRRLLLERLDAEDQLTRQMLLMRFFECRSFEEIAHELGHGETTVRRMIGQAALRLGTRLRDIGPEA